MYLDSCTEIGESKTHIEASSLDLVGLDLRLYGATILKSLSDQVSHVITDLRSIKYSF